MEKVKDSELINNGGHISFTNVLPISTIIDRIGVLLNISDTNNMKTAFDTIKMSGKAYLIDIKQFTNEGVVLMKYIGGEPIKNGQVTFYEFYQALERFIEDYQNR